MSISKNNIINPEAQYSAKEWLKYYRLNYYYHKNLQNFTAQLIPASASLLEIGSNGGEFLASIANKNKTGIVQSDDYLNIAKKRFPKIDFLNIKNINKLNGKKFDYVLINHIFSEITDIQEFIKILKKYTKEDSRIIVLYFNYLWKPLLTIGENLGLKRPQNYEPNWTSKADIDNFFSLESFDKVKSGRKFLIPYNIPLVANFVNKYISPFPIINSLSFINYSIYRPLKKEKNYSVSIIIPARNESGHLKGILKKIPKFGIKQEVIFVEGHSKDDTYEVIKKEINKYKGSIAPSLYKQKQKGKGDAVRLGFSKAKNEILMILDGDLTVGPEELPKFYHSISKGQADFIMGSRLIYPMEKEAMRTLNILGNKFFSVAFTFLLDQKIKDTLCGTKVLFKKDYEKIIENRKYFGNFDPFGDYDLIFGAAKINLQILEIPIRYKQRKYGKTNISRFTHGWLLLKMVLFAAKKLKFI